MSSLNPRIQHWDGLRVWVIGASSGIGAALCQQLQQQNCRLALSARNQAALQKLASTADLILPLDVTQADTLQQAKTKLMAQWGGFDLVIYCAGNYLPMRAWDMKMQHIKNILDTNLMGCYHTLDHVLPELIKQGSGGICMVASVAGYTGLPKALAYGPSKAAMINLAQILYSDLHPKGLGVYLVNPGFVDTPLTKQNDFQMPALISTEQAAKAIIQGLGKGQFEIHFPRRFSYFMKILAALPDRLRFKLLKRGAQ